MSVLNGTGHSWDSLIDHLKAVGPFLYYHNVGNAGDALIYLGMKRLFREHGISSYSFSEERYRRNRNVVYSGGGNLVPGYDHCLAFIEKKLANLETFTLLPHTVEGNENLLARLDSRFTLFCREERSFHHCLQHVGQGCRVELSHDLAFSIPRGGASWRVRPFFPTVSLDRSIRWRRKLRRASKHLAAGGDRFFRTDKEARSPGSVLGENLDLSQELSMVQRTHSQRCVIGETLLAFVERAPFVQTDRLHVAIAAALCGTPARLSIGSYHKNRSVYTHSIQPFFDTVEFVESEQ